MSRMLPIAVLNIVVFLALPVAGAWADEIYNDLDATKDSARETLTLTIPTSGETRIKVQPASGDGDAGCNFQPDGGTVTFSVASSNTAVATVSPATFTFDSCDDSQMVTVTPVSAGSANVTFSVQNDSSPGTWDPV